LRPFNSFLYRSIKYMKDCSGGYNQWLPCELFAAGDYDALLDILLALRKTAENAPEETFKIEVVERYVA
jgi:hypothetical protein